MRVKYLNYIYFLLGILVVAGCQEDGPGLSLEVLQAESIAEENRFILNASLGLTEFNTNNVQLDSLPEGYLLSAFADAGSLYIWFAELEKGTYSGANNSSNYIYFINDQGRGYSSNNALLNSDMRFSITAIDTSSQLFFADFSATLYDVESVNPNNRKDQLAIFNGRLNRSPL